MQFVSHRFLDYHDPTIGKYNHSRIGNRKTETLQCQKISGLQEKYFEYFWDSCPDLKKCPPGHFTFSLATKSEWYQDVLRFIEALLVSPNTI